MPAQKPTPATCYLCHGVAVATRTVRVLPPEERPACYDCADQTPQLRAQRLDHRLMAAVILERADAAAWVARYSERGRSLRHAAGLAAAYMAPGCGLNSAVTSATHHRIAEALVERVRGAA
jgi:hypothetical protein